MGGDGGFYREIDGGGLKGGKREGRNGYLGLVGPRGLGRNNYLLNFSSLFATSPLSPFSAELPKVPLIYHYFAYCLQTISLRTIAPIYRREIL